MAREIDAKAVLSVDGTDYQIYQLQAVTEGHVDRLPYSLKILLENLLRNADGGDVSPEDISAIANWDPSANPSHEISFTPARVILQDFTGVPAVVDLAAMRDAVEKLGGQADAINPLSPAELVIDHSVQVDVYGNNSALARNTAIEFSRNQERYSFLRWGQNAFRNFRVVPPNTGIVHQVNLEYLARVVFDQEREGQRIAYPDTVVGTDSHTTMINGLGVLGWGVGGIEAEAAMLGQPITMLIPQVIGFRLTGRLREGTTATDLVLTVTSMLREQGVVGKFVEFFGAGLSGLPLADRATLSNMAPEFGSTTATFPIDNETIDYLKLSGREPAQIALVEAYAKAQGIWREDGQAEALYTDILELDLGDVEPCISGPKRPHDRIALSAASSTYEKARVEETADRNNSEVRSASVTKDGRTFDLTDGAILIAAITSCTNTSNPSVMIGAGLLARNAHRKGLTTKPWVKTSLGPGSKVVSNYLEQSGLLADLDSLGFNIVGFGCTTCIGNSGPLNETIAEAVRDNDLLGCSVLSGNRNFEGRIHPLVKMNFWPPLHSSSPMRLPARWMWISARTRSARTPTAMRFFLRIFGRARQKFRKSFWPISTRRCSARVIRMYLPGTTTGTDSRSQHHNAMNGPRTRPMSGTRRISTACRCIRNRSMIFAAPGYWHCSVTMSQRTIFRLPDLFHPIRLPASTSWNKASTRRISTRMDRAVEIMKS